MPNEEKTRCCTNCGEPVKGHVGPTGKLCPNKTIDVDTDLNEGTVPVLEENKDNASESIDVMSGNIESSSFEVSKNEELAPVLSQLVSQMTMLNAGIQAVASGQKEIINAIKASDSFQSREHSNIDQVKTSKQQTKVTVPHSATSAISSCIKLPDKVVREAILGECINLIDFLPGNDIILSEQYKNPVDLPQGVMVVLSKKNKRNIDNFDVWLTAWNNYEALLVQNHPDIYPNLSVYRQLVQKCNRKYTWQSVYLYDVRFRMKLGSSRSFDFHVMDNDLYLTILDTTAVRTDAMRCFRCKSYEHVVTSCPFPS